MIETDSGSQRPGLPTQSQELFQQGVAAAQAGDQDTARSLFERFTAAEPGSAAAWLWRAHLSAEPMQQVFFLRRALDIQPDHPRAGKALIHALLHAGVARAKRGARDEARALMEEVVRRESNVEVAWMWLASLADNAQDKARCLNAVLRLNPGHERARAWLEGLAPMLAGRATADPAGGSRDGASGTLSDDGRHEPGDTMEATAAAAQADPVPAQAAPAPAQVASDPPAGEAARRDPEPPAADAESSPHQARVVEPAEPVQASGDAVQTPAPSADPSEVVLVVDDSQTIRNIVSRTLSRHGYEVITATNAHEALAQLNETLPNLVFLDIKLPEMDGFELCRRIKHKPRTRHVPVVMLSGRDGFVDKVHGKIVGAEGYITKPFQPQDLLNALGLYGRSRQETTGEWSH